MLEPINPFLKTQLAQAYLTKSNFLANGAKPDKNLAQKAKGLLEEAMRLNPNYSNTRFFLGLVYDKEGKEKEALEQMQAVLSLNPDNDTVKQIVNNLKAGRSALGGSSEIPPLPENAGQP